MAIQTLIRSGGTPIVYKQPDWIWDKKSGKFVYGFFKGQTMVICAGSSHNHFVDIIGKGDTNGQPGID